jgi:hypothetical protein
MVSIQQDVHLEIGDNLNNQLLNCLNEFENIASATPMKENEIRINLKFIMSSNT